MALVMPRDALVHVNGTRLSDHSRSPVDQSPERIGNQVRTARGRLKKKHVVDKMSFSMSWERLPAEDTRTVDGFWGAENLINFYKTTPGEFTFSLVRKDGTTINHTVVFEEFSYTIIYRYDTYYYDISMSVVEV